MLDFEKYKHMISNICFSNMDYDASYNLHCVLAYRYRNITKIDRTENFKNYHIDPLQLSLENELARNLWGAWAGATDIL